MQSGINTAWLGFSLTTHQITTWTDAWHILRARPEWRDWVRQNMTNPDVFFNLMIRDDIDRRRLMKTKNGISMHLPAAEVAAADREDRLEALYFEVIRAIYQKWSLISGCPSPPDIPQ